MTMKSEVGLRSCCVSTFTTRYLVQIIAVNIERIFSVGHDTISLWYVRLRTVFPAVPMDRTVGSPSIVTIFLEKHAALAFMYWLTLRLDRKWRSSNLSLVSGFKLHWQISRQSLTKLHSLVLPLSWMMFYSSRQGFIVSRLHQKRMPNNLTLTSPENG